MPVHPSRLPIVLVTGVVAATLVCTRARLAHASLDPVDWRVVVPEQPGGYASGCVGIRLELLPLPMGVDPFGRVSADLSQRTGIGGTVLAGLRTEIALPLQVRFDSIELRVADGLVLQREDSFWRAAGRFVLSVVRLILLGQLAAASDDLQIPGAAWATAVGVPTVENPMVRLRSADALRLDADDPRVTDHGEFVVLRAVLAVTPWTELVQVRIVGVDTTNGQEVLFDIPRLVLPDGGHVPTPVPEAKTTAWLRLEEMVLPPTALGSRR